MAWRADLLLARSQSNRHLWFSYHEIDDTSFELATPICKSTEGKPPCIDQDEDCVNGPVFLWNRE